SALFHGCSRWWPCQDTPRRRTGARTALSASSLDLIRADMAVRAPIGGSYKSNSRRQVRLFGKFVGQTPRWVVLKGSGGCSLPMNPPLERDRSPVAAPTK